MNVDLKSFICSIMSQTELAKRLGTTPQSVSLWLNSEAPAHRVIPICEALNWKVTPHQMRKDIYPNPTDGLPDQQD
ncbi:helix-turn-helix domain-containing protein [Salmonella enterica subsp. enterica serovar Cerro]|nr:helix-turn-helix domain-containing protein [Salmonella enterica]EBS5941944.1 Cro/Cl family transcriptional regulator [Salmonella enterica subsp. enterica serovar Cerro]EBV1479065.1 Cro/Cl family transcriptional regulator [Salmonella enterica subsp. enterica serovar Cerro]ECU0148919.1 Cro/Cl family transcriptional regulator [Salmonella enterica]EGQ7593848.1 helix-turn-helix domain-containing protein [Salmonella enterica subsp. enterica serovar Cerro]